MTEHLIEDLYIVAIAALLPLTACILVSQVNPYHALVLRGILGGVAVLVYALFGAADVALTEALVGTMLSITLYAVAVRSSLSMRLGILENELNSVPTTRLVNAEQVMIETASVKQMAVEQVEHRLPIEKLLATLRKTLSKYYMRLELVPYPSHHALQTALITKDVHAICMIQQQPLNMQPSCHIQTRIQRLYQIMQTMQTDLSPTLASLVHVTFMDLNLSTTNPIDAHSTGIEMSNPSEVES